MKFFPYLCVLFVFLFLTCSYERTITPDDESMGDVNVSVKLGKIGSLGKIKCIEFDTLTLTLTAPGEDSVVAKMPISGKNQQIVTKTFSNLASLKTWTVLAVAKDRSEKTTHFGKTTFEVQPNATTEVTLDLAARFSMLKANFYPIRDSVNACMLWVDDEIAADSSFSRTELRGDTVRLSYDYLSASPAGILHTIRMDARGIVWGDDTLLYRGDTAVTAVSGENETYTIKLKWVGPNTPPPGAATMTVVLGATGSVTVNGELEDKLLKEMKEIYQVNSTASIKVNQWITDLGPSRARDSLIQYMSMQVNVRKTLLSSDSGTIEIVYMNGLRALADIGRPGTLSSPGSYKGVSASATDERDNEINYLIDKLSSTTAINMSLWKKNDFSLEAITELHQYGLIHIATHGGYDSRDLPYIITGEKYVKPTNESPYYEDWLDGGIGEKIIPEIVSNRWAVFPAFIKKYNRNIPQSIVFLSSCQSMHNGSVLANAFLDNNAAVVFGWEGYVTNEFASLTTKKLLNSMIVNKYSAQEAFNHIPMGDRIDPGSLAEFKMATKTEAKLPLVYKLTVSVDPPNSGTIALDPNKDKYLDGDAVTLTASPATDYRFTNWTGDATGTTNSITITMDKDKNIVANFIRLYTVTFNSQGGSDVPSQVVDAGGFASEPLPPTRNGYTFGRWFKEPACVNEWIFANEPVISDVTLNAKWTINRYPVTFDPQGGSAVPSQTVNYGEYATEPNPPTRTGYTFAEWYKEAECTNPWVFANEIVTAPVMIYAKWSLNGTVIDIDGNVYTTVTLGTQTWMVENLKTTKYNDGTPISIITDNTAWANCSTTQTPAYCWYDNNVVKKDTFGALYNWYAVNSGKLAPFGWHIPTDAEWITLQNYLIANGYNYDGTKTGNKTAKSLAANWRWGATTFRGMIGTDLTKNNRSGFSALPGGFRTALLSYGFIGWFATWWSATEDNASGGATYYGLDNNEIEIPSDREYGLIRENDRKYNGFSVRLLRDY